MCHAVIQRINNSIPSPLVLSSLFFAMLFLTYFFFSSPVASRATLFLSVGPGSFLVTWPCHVHLLFFSTWPTWRCFVDSLGARNDWTPSVLAFYCNILIPLRVTKTVLVRRVNVHILHDIITRCKPNVGDRN